jgi:predicted transposase/invertase (TIGR01784 family)
MADKDDYKPGTIKYPHDHFVKEVLSHKENARSFLENYLPEEIRHLFDIASLEIEKDSFIAQDLQDYYSDLLYKVRFAGHEGYVYLLFEHKSYAEKWITLQLLEYILQIWKLKRMQGQKLPMVIPLVLYHGKTQWKIGLKLSDLLEHKEDTLLRYIPDFQYILYDLSSYTDKDIRGIEKLKVMLYLLKYISSSELGERLSEILRLLKDMPESEMDYLVAITVYILHTTEISYQKFSEVVAKNISRKGGEIAMTTAEQLIAQGKLEGLKEGLKEGKMEGLKEGLKEGKMEGLKEGKMEGLKEGKMEVVRGALKMGLDVETISKLTGVDKAEIRKLQSV